MHEPGEVYRGDDYIYWGFGAGGLSALAAHAGFARVTINATATFDGHRASSPRSSGRATDQVASEDSPPAASRSVCGRSLVTRIGRPGSGSATQGGCRAEPPVAP